MRKSAFHALFLWALAALLAAALAPHALGQKRKEPVLPAAPPPVVPQKVRATVGETVTIPLGIHGARSQELKFLVRTRPKRGRLGPIVATGANSAAITYTPDGDDEGEDRFTYAVRSSEGVSAPALVTISIAPRPVVPRRLTVEDPVDFGTFFAGDEVTRTLRIANRGGGMLEGKVTVQAPWSVKGPAEYRLGAGAVADVTLALKSDKPGRVTGEALLGPDPKRLVILTGIAEAPVLVSPEKLVLQPKTGSQTRAGLLKIENRTSDVLPVSFKVSERLIVDRTTIVRARAAAEVPVFAEASHPESFTEVIRLEAGAWAMDLPVQVEPLPPMVKLTPHAQGDATVTADAPVELHATLEHQGGVRTAAVLSVNTPFDLSEKQVELQPGDKKPVRVTAPALAPGRHVAVLTASFGPSSARVELPVEVKPAPMPTRKETGAARQEPRTIQAVAPSVERTSDAGNAAASKKTGTMAVNLTQGTRREEFPNGMGNFVKELSPRRAVLVWPAELGPATNLMVEERRLTLGPDKAVVVNWIPLAGVTVKTDTNPYRAELPRLEPGQVYTVRVRAEGATLFTSQFTTPEKPPFLSLDWQVLTISALVLALIVVGWIRWKRRTTSQW